MRHSEQIDKLAEALAKAQGVIDPPKKNKTAKVQMKSGGSYSFDYADLSDVIAAVRRPLSDNGLAFTFAIDSNEQGKALLDTRLMHTSGQWIGCVYPLKLIGTPQENGSELTYAKRYTLCGLVGIASEEDDDGNAASGNGAQIQPKASTRPQPKPAPQVEQPTVEKASDEQVQKLKALLAEVALPAGTTDKWLAKAGVQRWEEMPADPMGNCIRLLEQKKAVKQAQQQEVTV